MYSIDASEDTAELKEQVARLNGHVSFLQTEKASLEKEKSSLAEKLSTLQHRVEELKSLGDRVPLLEAEVEKVPLLEAELEKYRPLESKLREREAEIEELVNLVPARCDQAVAEFKESEEFKALLLITPFGETSVTSLASFRHLLGLTESNPETNRCY